MILRRKETAMPTAELIEGTLESRSLWYRYKTLVWPEESAQRDVVHNIMRVLRSIGGFTNLAYASVPITTGPEYCERYRFCRTDEDRKKLLEWAIQVNFRTGLDFFDRLVERLGHPVIFPAYFEPVHQFWEQPHFQALWLEIIAEMCTSLHLGKGWNLSNGCVEEYVHVMQLRLGLPNHDHLNFFNTRESETKARERMRSIKVYEGLSDRELPVEEGIRILTSSVAWLKREQCPFEKVERALELLKWTDRMIKEGFYQ